MTAMQLSYDGAPGHLAARIINMRERLPEDRALIVGFGGPSAAGKGHLMDRLSLTIDDWTFGVLELDRYYKGLDVMAREGVTSFDDPRSVELSLAASHLDALRRRSPVQAPVYDFPSGLRVREAALGDYDIWFVDGLFALTLPILPRLDLKVFIGTDPHSALLRRLFRDAGPSGRTRQSSRTVIGQYVRDVLPAQRSFIDPTEADADIVIASRYDAKRESDRAGMREHQIKVRGTVDEERLRSIGAEHLATVVHNDRYLVPKDRSVDGETVRIRIENGDTHLFTYKGPLIEGLAEEVRVKAKRDVEIDGEIAERLHDVYREVAAIRKIRRLYAAPEGAAIQIAVDRVEGLGDFVELRSSWPAGRDLARWFSHLITQMGLEPTSAANPAIFESYLDLWRKKNS